MSLRSVVTGAVKTVNKVTKSFQGPVILNRWTGENVLGEAYPRDQIIVQAVVDPTPGKTFKSDGIELPVRAMVYIISVLAPQGAAGRTEPIDVRDEFVLPGIIGGKIANTPGIQDPVTAQPYFSQVTII